MIKVMHVLTDTNIGGAGVYLANYLNRYSKDKFDISVLLPENARIETRLKCTGAKIIHAKGMQDKSFSIKAVTETIRIIKSEKPDIMHTHASLSARVAAFLCGVPSVNTRHCIEQSKSFPKNIIYGFINNLLSCKVVAVSNAVYDNLIEDGIKKEKLCVIYNGIEPLKKYSYEEKLKLKKELGIPENAKAVGLVARLEEVKNPLSFVRAAKRICKKRDDIYFVLTGDGSLKDRVHSECTGEDKIILTGYRDDIENIYNALDIITLTSVSEALSISLLEGMSIELGAISTNSGGPCEIIENGTNGLITDIYDDHGLADAILTLVDNPNMLSEFGKKGKETVYTKFGISEMIKKTENLYEEIYKKGCLK